MPELPAVAIVGCGAHTAAGAGTGALRSCIQSNASGLRSVSRFELPRFQTGVVGAAPTENDGRGTDDPAFFLAVKALEEARTEAADVLEDIPPERIALVLSTTKANIEAFERLSDGRTCSAAARRHIQGDLLAEDLAAAHGARGPVQCVSLACVSGLVALQHGKRMLQRGDADAAIIVGVDHLSAFVMAGFTALKALDPQGCRPFDKRRCGLSPGEAGAAVVLAKCDRRDAGKFTNRSNAPIFIKGWGSSNDANHMTGPARDGSGLATAIQTALVSANVGTQEIDYINAHGTGTPYNDAMESAALRKIFSDNCPPLSGSKGMLGHTLGAAGVVETIVCVLAMQQRIMPGTPRLDTPDDCAPLNLLHKARSSARLNHVLKLGTGFGGVNGAMVLSLTPGEA